MKRTSCLSSAFALLSVCFFSCGENKVPDYPVLVKAMNLKTGAVISCGPAGNEFGEVNFVVSGSPEIAKEFNLAVKLLHSFEYDEAEKVFAGIIAKEPTLAMAYWGVAMANFHPLWTPPTETELKKGAQALAFAMEREEKSPRERAYIEALATYYNSWETVDHRTRCLAFEKAMEALYKAFPDDKETAVFYALSLVAAADPSDKTYAKQKKAGDLLNRLYPGQPDHPGIVHYIIHTYDYPELATAALPAARKYASVAPSSAHALHMPSHIFTRLGLWEEAIGTNLASVASAQCYAEQAGIRGHWDEELHGLDYLVYAYLQKGDNDAAKKQWDYLAAINEVQPVNFKVAYAFAAIPSRYLVENRLWKEAASLQVKPANFDWKAYPWQKAMIHFTRLLGAVHTGQLDAANGELAAMVTLQQELAAQKDAYKVNQVGIQIASGDAWIKWKEGKRTEALQRMQEAADLEDKTGKHPVTPGEVVPAKELLGDLLLQMAEPEKALAVYTANLQKHPKRFNGLYGAAVAAERSGRMEEARALYRQLLSVAKSGASERPELSKARNFVKG
ncbi:tetratricopeptide repeat protein [Flavisolibacter sp. BT320]|nr:tetratricopeptide repeat protein [Flavisolibacter longurius]